MFQKLCGLLTQHCFRKSTLVTAQGEHCYVCKICGKTFWAYEEEENK